MTTILGKRLTYNIAPRYLPVSFKVLGTADLPCAKLGLGKQGYYERGQRVVKSRPEGEEIHSKEVKHLVETRQGVLRGKVPGVEEQQHSRCNL